MLTDFYIAYATVTFTLLGLWLIIVQTRHSQWQATSALRRRTYAMALYFSLPGLMSLLPMVNPASMTLWRASFAILATSTAIVLLLMRGSLPAAVGRMAYLTAVALCVLIAVLATAPTSVRAVRVEPILLIIVLYFDVSLAWLLFDETPAARPHRTQETRAFLVDALLSEVAAEAAFCDTRDLIADVHSVLDSADRLSAHHDVGPATATLICEAQHDPVVRQALLDRFAELT